ncbi:hypothetical protein QBC43DRAFT_371220 [Cladorrhinum sp. PSN259]|nr:hypothetical protein QBC43DRAFT_371220 [Cladorrhinum sp. PSN259]
MTPSFPSPQLGRKGHGDTKSTLNRLPLALEKPCAGEMWLKCGDTASRYLLDTCTRLSFKGSGEIGYNTLPVSELVSMVVSRSIFQYLLRGRKRLRVSVFGHATNWKKMQEMQPVAGIDAWQQDPGSKYEEVQASSSSLSWQGVRQRGVVPRAISIRAVELDKPAMLPSTDYTLVSRSHMCSIEIKGRINCIHTGVPSPGWVWGLVWQASGVTWCVLGMVGVSKKESEEGEVHGWMGPEITTAVAAALSLTAPLEAHIEAHCKNDLDGQKNPPCAPRPPVPRTAVGRCRPGGRGVNEWTAALGAPSRRGDGDMSPSLSGGPAGVILAKALKQFPPSPGPLNPPGQCRWLVGCNCAHPPCIGERYNHDCIGASQGPTANFCQICPAEATLGLECNIYYTSNYIVVFRIANVDNDRLEDNDISYEMAASWAASSSSCSHDKHPSCGLKTAIQAGNGANKPPSLDECECEHGGFLILLRPSKKVPNTNTTKASIPKLHYSVRRSE